MSGLSQFAEQFLPWYVLTKALSELRTFNAAKAQAEPCAFFRICGSDIGGPQGNLPIKTAGFAIHPQAAKLLDDLATGLMDAKANFGINIDPAHLGIHWDISDQEIVGCNDTPLASDTFADPWCLTPEPTAKFYEESFANIHSISTESTERQDGCVKSCKADVSCFEIAVNPQGEVWFHVDMEGPSTADVPMPREILREIAAGYPETPSPSM